MFDFLMGYVMGERAATRAASMTRAAAGSAGSTAGEFHDVNERVDRLILVVDAMWSLLKDSGWTDEQLKERLTQIDLVDGVEDGRRTPTPTRCTKCDSMVQAGRATCAFCGVPVAAAVGPTDHV
jgi:hypothetical protein